MTLPRRAACGLLVAAVVLSGGIAKVALDVAAPGMHSDAHLLCRSADEVLFLEPPVSGSPFRLLLFPGLVLLLGGSALACVIFWVAGSIRANAVRRFAVLISLLLAGVVLIVWTVVVIAIAQRCSPLDPVGEWLPRSFVVALLVTLMSPSALLVPLWVTGSVALHPAFEERTPFACTNRGLSLLSVAAMALLCGAWLLTSQ